MYKEDDRADRFRVKELAGDSHIDTSGVPLRLRLKVTLILGTTENLLFSVISTTHPIFLGI